MRNPTIYKVFVAGPSDVSKEIEITREVIENITTLTSSLGIMFETFFWAEDATPGIASEAQERINTQASGYDIFISIMGSKIGFPTKNYKSGTIEEIENAINDSNSSKFRHDSVLIYFKTIEFNSKSPNIRSLLEVQDFREKLGSRGILFKDFSTEIELQNSILKSFGKIIRTHIDKITTIDETATDKLYKPNDDIDATSEIIVNDAEDLGFLDLDDIISDNMSNSTDMLHQLTEAMNILASDISQATEEMSKAIFDKDNIKGRSIIFKISQDMDKCSGIIEEKSINLSENFRKSADLIKNLIEIRINTEDNGQGEEYSREIVENLKDTAIAARDNIPHVEEFQRQIQSMPRITKEINYSKRRLLEATSKNIAMFEEVFRYASEVENFYQGLINRSNRNASIQ